MTIINDLNRSFRILVKEALLVSGQCVGAAVEAVLDKVFPLDEPPEPQR